MILSVHGFNLNLSLSLNLSLKLNLKLTFNLGLSSKIHGSNTWTESMYLKYNSFFDLKAKEISKIFHFSCFNFITKIENWKNFLKFILWFEIKKWIRIFWFLFFEIDFKSKYIRVRKRPFHFCSIFNNFKKMKIDYGQFSIQFLNFQIRRKIENLFFGNFQINFQFLIISNKWKLVLGNFQFDF